MDIKRMELFCFLYETYTKRFNEVIRINLEKVARTLNEFNKCWDLLSLNVLYLKCKRILNEA